MDEGPIKVDTQGSLAHKNDNSEDVNDDFSPLFDYLKTDNGHELATKIIGFFEGIKKETLVANSTHVRIEKWVQGGIVLSVIIATCYLVNIDKFDSSIGILFGTLVGYMFGKKSF